MMTAWPHLGRKETETEFWTVMKKVNRVSDTAGNISEDKKHSTS
jgi:hypothetical protein